MAVTSPVAFESLEKNSILATSFSVAHAFSVETGISTHLAIALEDASKASDFDCEILVCDPSNPHSLAQAIKNSTPCDLVAIHDSQRPLTRTVQFHRVLEALIGDVQAVRPAGAFTETLKSITNEETIEGTIDRTSVLRISTPEIIDLSAIDFNGNNSTWFVPLNQDAKTMNVEADPESLRVNSVAEVELMESFVHWRQSIA
uniref:2-C-methyl-D-erythritol 4-phosphate cytidylyltransferase n=1 Tax=Candidatus Planktophila sp. TaxID=2175601 RepID=UPI00404A25F1